MVLTITIIISYYCYYCLLLLITDQDSYLIVDTIIFGIIITITITIIIINVHFSVSE